jgi:hypothetical protein
VKLVNDLVHALMRYPEPACSVGAVDRIGAVEPGVCQKHVETHTVLARYRLHILCDCVKQRNPRLPINGDSKSRSVLPQETPVKSKPQDPDLIDGEITLREPWRSRTVAVRFANGTVAGSRSSGQVADMASKSMSSTV